MKRRILSLFIVLLLIFAFIPSVFAEDLMTASPDTAQTMGTPSPTDTVQSTDTTETTDTPSMTDTPIPTDTPQTTETPQPTYTPIPTETTQPEETPQPTKTEEQTALSSGIKFVAGDITLVSGKSTLFLRPRETVTLTAAVSPDTAAVKDIIWESSNYQIASVNNGVVTAGIHTGNATITVTTLDGEYSAICDVRVEPAECIVMYDSQGGSCLWEDTVKYGSAVLEPSIPYKSGYYFCGWYPTSSCDTTEITFPYYPEEDITLHAKWESPDSTGTSNGYSYNIKDGKATITGYSGNDKDIIIPDKLGGYTVTRIDGNAFYKSSITSVVIPEGVTSIGANAFEDCRYLGKIIMPDSIASIGVGAFMNCGNLQEVTIPKGVNKIEDDAFYGCDFLKSVVIPDSVTKIRQDAFYFCYHLESITIPGSVTIIESIAFDKCEALNRVYFLGNAPTMGYRNIGGEYVFSNCASNLTVYYLSGSTGFTNPWYGYPTAVYNPNTICTVSFNMNGSKSYSPPPTDQKVYWGQKAIKPPVDPYLNGYAFGGWGLDPSKPNEAWDFNTDCVTTDIKLYALWIPNSVPFITEVFPQGYNYIYITWNGVKGAKGYQVFRSTAEDGAYKMLGSTKKFNFNDFKVELGITYYYKIRSYSGSGSKTKYSGFSDTKYTVTSFQKVYNPRISVYSPTCIKISWKAVDGRTAYDIERLNTASGSFEYLGSTKNAYYNDTGLITNTQYSYRVRAYRTVNGQKVYGDYSDIVSGTPVLNKVTGLKAKVSSATQIKLSWGAVKGASGFEIVRSLSQDNGFLYIGSATKTNYKDNGLTVKTRYYYRIRAYILIGGEKYYTDYSAVVSASPH